MRQLLQRSIHRHGWMEVDGNSVFCHLRWSKIIGFTKRCISFPTRCTRISLRKKFNTNTSLMHLSGILHNNGSDITRLAPISLTRLKLKAKRFSRQLPCSSKSGYHLKIHEKIKSFRVLYANKTFSSVRALWTVKLGVVFLFRFWSSKWMNKLAAGWPTSIYDSGRPDGRSREHNNRNAVFLWSCRTLYFGTAPIWVK